MSFEQEWAQLKSAATERHSAHMRLNQLPADGGATTPDLATSPAKKKAAANTIENHLEPGTKSAANAADEPIRTAVGEFKGWETGAGLKKAHEHWDSQVKRLMGRLSSEKTGLRNASATLIGNDVSVEQNFGSPQSRIADL
ncbi:hypothetical protein [Streptomyces sp. NPDC051662]|uniref:hypothetical protein n=1 Tax=Streptomyces sp. NPDC051662 TaxID=3154750 RepID=UPI003418DA27